MKNTDRSRRPVPRSADQNAESESIKRLGFLRGEFITPDDFDRLGENEIEEMFGISESAQDP